MIVRYPNVILMNPTYRVDPSRDGQLKDLVNDMFRQCEESQGVGLAGNQFGTICSVFVMSFKDKEQMFNGAFLNPEIVSHSTETIVAPERCLSLPGIAVNKERWKSLKARWQDLEGNWHEEDMDGLKAIIFQHEYDHLQGCTIVSSLPTMKRKMLVDKMKKNNIKSARMRAKEMGIPISKDAQEKVDIYTGKRMSDE